MSKAILTDAVEPTTLSSPTQLIPATSKADKGQYRKPKCGPINKVGRFKIKEYQRPNDGRKKFAASGWNDVRPAGRLEGKSGRDNP